MYRAHFIVRFFFPKRHVYVSFAIMTFINIILKKKKNFLKKKSRMYEVENVKKNCSFVFLPSFWKIIKSLICRFICQAEQLFLTSIHRNQLKRFLYLAGFPI